MANGLIIGLSTGWLHAAGKSSTAIQKAFVFSSRANAIELCLGDSLLAGDPRVYCLLNGDDISGCHWLPYRSLHLPDYNPNESREAQAKMAAKITERHLVNVAVIHPLKCKSEGGYPLDYYADLKDMGVCLAIENMDKNKPSGFRIQELARLVEFADLGFVLDLQHAYEHDSSMSYAQDLFCAMKSRLVHLHVSGQSAGQNHSLVCRSENASAIAAFLGRIFSEMRVPIILEGEYRVPEDIEEEIAFFERELGLQEAVS